MPSECADETVVLQGHGSGSENAQHRARGEQQPRPRFEEDRVGCEGFPEVVTFCFLDENINIHFHRQMLGSTIPEEHQKEI